MLIAKQELERLVQQTLRRAGLNEPALVAVSRSIVACEADGAKSHGLLRIPAFVHSLTIGWAIGSALPEIRRETESLIAIDAHRGFAQHALALAKEELIAKARRTGVAMLLTRNSHHFSALWPDVEPFAEAGLVALTCVNSKKRMAAWGGGKAVLGTSAMAFASPRQGHLPLVWDQSSSIMSQGDLLLASQEGRSVPEGVGCDARGQPSTSPKDILNGGALSPFGGHKGASLAVMVEILSAALSGGPFGFEDNSPTGAATTSLGGQFLLLIDPRVSVDDFYTRIEGLIAAIIEAGAEKLPGDRRYAIRAQSRTAGVQVDRSALQTLLVLAGESKAP